MRRFVGACLLLSAIVALPSAELHAQKDKKKKMDAPDKPKVDSAKLSGEFFGTLKSTPGSDRIFVIESETKRLVATPTKGGNKGNANANANRLIQIQNQLTQDQQRLRTAKTPQQRGQVVQQMQRHQVQLQQAIAQMQRAGAGGVPAGYKIDTVKQNIEFQAAETVKVRTLLLPETFDDKGNAKKYTKEEKAALVGKDKNLPGFESSLEKLEAGQKIRVVLAPAPAAKKDNDKDADKDATADKKMQVKLIVISEEGTAPAVKGKAKKK